MIITFRSKDQILADRRTAYEAMIKKKTEWHTHFCLWPRPVSDTELAWLTYVQKRLNIDRFRKSFSSDRALYDPDLYNHFHGYQYRTYQKALKDGT